MDDLTVNERLCKDMDDNEIAERITRLEGLLGMEAI